MTTYSFNHPAEFVGPAGSTIEATLMICFEHHRAEPDVNAEARICIDLIDVDIGGARVSFNGDYSDLDLVAACWAHVAEEAERVECDRADMERDART